MVRKKLLYAQNYRRSLEQVIAADQTGSITGVDHRRAGKRFVQQGNYEAALKHFLLALTLGIETAQIGQLHTQTGKAAMHLENYTLAAEHFHQAINTGEATSFTHANLARSLYHLQEDKEVVEAHFLQALALDKKSSWAYNWYATLLKETGRLAEAEQAAREAVALHKDHAIFLNNLALIFEAYGDRAHLLEAERYLTMAVVYAKPDFSEPQEHLQRVRTHLAQDEAT